jgi:phage/plasmid-like protein (TIGR03299 family)
MSIDVNEAFAAERAAQISDALSAPERAAEAARKHNANVERRIADGKMVPIGGGKYKVVDPGSWDDGEVWNFTLRDVEGEANAVSVVLPEHGLDETTGRPALYTAVPAWHGLGTVVPGGLTSIYDVLALGGIDYEVSKRPVQYRNPLTGELETLPGQYVTTREDTGAGLGVVGERYEVFQSNTVFSFLHDLLGTSDVVCESAGALRGGARIFICLRMPETVTVDREGVNDAIVPYIVALNSYDGSGQAQVVATPWRPVCGNTERFAVRDAVTRWGVRHTSGGLDRIDEARRTLDLASKYFEHFAAEEEALAQTRITMDEVQKLINDLWPAPDGAINKAAQTRYVNHVNDVLKLWDSNSARLGSTAYAAERMVTEFSDWKSEIRPTGSLKGNRAAARATAMLEGSKDDLKSKAHKRLLTLTNR